MKILIVEDSEILRTSLTRGLRKCGYAVSGEGDGAEGLFRALHEDFNALILDVNLPGLTGFELLEKLRGAGRQVPVLMLTARDGLEDRVAGLRHGADDYLVKPFAFAELQARLEALIRRAHGVASNRLRLGPLELDLAARRLWREGEEITLARREFALLHCLALKAGQVVSRSEIEEAIYDERTDPMSNVVDASVSMLRRRIDRPGAESLIATRRGQGYMLAVAQ